MVSESPVSRIYAQALIQLGDKHDSLTSVAEEFGLFHRIWVENDSVRRHLSSPAISREKKLAFINHLGKGRFSDLFRRFLSILAHKGRISLLDQVHESFQKAIEERGGMLRAKITFAVCTEELLVSKLEQDLSQKLNKKVSLWVKQNPEILGGMVLQIGDRVIDMSVRNRLRQFRKAVIGRS